MKLSPWPCCALVLVALVLTARDAAAGSVTVPVTITNRTDKIIVIEVSNGRQMNLQPGKSLTIQGTVVRGSVFVECVIATRKGVDPKSADREWVAVRQNGATKVGIYPKRKDKLEIVPE